MKYVRDREGSGEILRLLIQKMAGHPAAFTPLTYAVWYEFTTGINPALTQAMSSLLDGGEKLDDDIIENLHVKFVAECNLDVQRAVQNDIRQLLGNLSGFAEETDKQAHRFGDSLQTYGDILKQGLDALKLGALISSLAGDTTRMRSSMQTLQSELEASKQQVEKLHRELESAREEALVDPLTGILNRRGFEIKLQNAISDNTSADKGFCLLLADIDRFKQTNDTYGHLFGDSVIRATASALKSKIKGQDSVARWGGEEFVVLLPETTKTGARAVAEQIRRSIERGKILRFGTQEQIGGITISIGITAYSKGSSMAALLEQADKALYASKEQGRNRTTVYGQN